MRHVELYAQEMLAGRWVVGDPIKFNEDGTLGDGQHRLYAVMRSGCTIQFSVLRGSGERDCFADHRKPRSIVDSFHIISGEENLRVYARSIQAIHSIKAYVDGKDTRAKLTNLGAFQFWAENERELRNSRAVVGDENPVVMTTPRMIAWHFFFRHHPEKAEQFIYGLKTGENLPKTSPIYLLRRLLLENLKSTKDTKPRTKTALIIKAWNLFVSGSTVESLRFSPAQEDFPSIN